MNFKTFNYQWDVQNIWHKADATNNKDNKFKFLIGYLVYSGEMKYNEEVDDVGAVEGSHVEHKDDLGPLDECDSQDVGQRPIQAPQRSEGRDENGE